MNILQSVVLVLHLGVAIAVCGLVLLQHGKGADMGAAFGSGSSGSLFGASGSANFLSRLTAALATVFFLSSLGLSYLGATSNKSRDLMQDGVMSGVPAEGKSADIPKSTATPAPAGSAAAPAPAPAVPAGPASKAGDIPK